MWEGRGLAGIVEGLEDRFWGVGRAFEGELGSWSRGLGSQRTFLRGSGKKAAAIYLAVSVILGLFSGFFIKTILKSAI